MLTKLQNAFWKALTPDLVPDEPKQAEVRASLLPANVLSALGGQENLASQQRVAVTRIRVQLRDTSLLDAQALGAAQMPPVLMLPNGVIHVLTPMPTPVAVNS